MNPVATTQPQPAADGGVKGPLSTEAASLGHSLDEIRVLFEATPTLDDRLVLAEAMCRIRRLVNHIAAHGHAEEHVVYPYIETFMSGSQAELATLRADHARLDNLSRAIIEWTPAQAPGALHDLLVEFLEISQAHLLIEGEDCMPVVHAHVLAGAEQALFEAVEMETFERLAAASPGLVAR